MTNILTGTCCMKCCVHEVPCMSAGSNSTLCSGCDASATCDPGLHIEVRLFQLGVVHIPAEIEEKIMSVVLSQVIFYYSVLPQTSMYLWLIVHNDSVVKICENSLFRLLLYRKVHFCSKYKIYKK